MEAYFIIAHIDGGSKKFKLCNGEFVIIGRSASYSQVQLTDPQCSSKHCKVSMANNRVYVEDLDSKNGIYLNGVRVIKQTFYIGDKLKVGNNVLYIHEGKLGPIDKEYLTYQGGGHRKSGDLTFEVDAPNFNSGEVGRKQIRSTPNNELKLAGRQRELPKNFESNRNISKTKKAMFDTLAFFIDLAISFMIFVVGIRSFAFIFTKEYEALALKNSLLKIMFSEEMGLYTLIVCIVSIGFFTLNRKRKSGSLGERILKIN